MGECGECNQETFLKLECAHETKITIPCSVATKTDSRLLPWMFQSKCTEPCGKRMTYCEDTCKGTCGQCYGSKIHITCSRKRVDMLPCGHEKEREHCLSNEGTCVEKCQREY